METEKIELINLVNSLAKTILTTTDNFINNIENEKLKKIIANYINKLDTLVDECKLLIKSYNKELEDINFFEKYQNLISLKIANLTKKTTCEIAEILYLTISNTMPKLYSKLILNELDEITLVKKLISVNEEFLNNLKPMFIIKD